MSLLRRVHFVVACLAGALLCPAEPSAAIAQVVTFVEFGELGLFPMAAGPEADPLTRVRNHHHLTTAVLKTREWVLSGKRLDFAVIYGLGLEGLDPANLDVTPIHQEAIAERLRIFQSLPVEIIAVLPSAADVASKPSFNLDHYRRFVALFRTLLKSKQIVDLTEGVLIYQDFQILGINGPLFFKRTVAAIPEKELQLLQEAELQRLRDRMALNKPTIVCSSVHDLDAAGHAVTAWSGADAVRRQASAFIQDQRVAGVFGAPQAATEWTIFGSPHPWRKVAGDAASSAKAWLTPCLAIDGEASNGLQFVTLTSEGAVTATPFSFPRMPPLELRPELSHKLREGIAHREAGDYENASAAFGEALASKDAAVAADAQRLLHAVLLERRRDAFRDKIAAGTALLNAERYDDAVAALSEALASKDPAVAMKAEEQLAKSLEGKNEASDGPLWRLIPLQVRSWLAIFYITGSSRLILAAILVALFLYALYKQCCRPNPYLAHWTVRQLTETSEAVPMDLALEEFHFAVAEIRELPQFLNAPNRRIRPPREGLPRITAPLAVENAIPEGHFTLGGVDVNFLLRMLSRARNYFTWKLEVRIGVVNDRPHVYAALCYGSHVERRWHIPAATDDPPSSVREAGRDLAYAVFARDWIQS